MVYASPGPGLTKAGQKKLGPRQVKTNWVPGPVNKKSGSGPGGGQGQGRRPSRGLGAGKYKYPLKLIKSNSDDTKVAINIQTLDLKTLARCISNNLIVLNLK